MLSMSRKLPVYNAIREKCDDIKPSEARWCTSAQVVNVKIIIQFMDAIL